MENIEELKKFCIVKRKKALVLASKFFDTNKDHQGYLQLGISRAMLDVIRQTSKFKNIERSKQGRDFPSLADRQNDKAERHNRRL